MTSYPPAVPAFLRLLIGGFGMLGIMFIVYGAATLYFGEPWPPLERIAEPLSSGLTILGTLTTAVSIYFYKPDSTPPEPMSYRVTAPAVIVLCLGALGVLWQYGLLPPIVVNGFAMMGMAGAMARIQQNPYFVRRGNPDR